ncbi:hypothetical protein Ancab_039249 [Ancistrocladus abbreviatus]
MACGHMFFWGKSLSESLACMRETARIGGGGLGASPATHFGLPPPAAAKYASCSGAQDSSEDLNPGNQSAIGVSGVSEP